MKKNIFIGLLLLGLVSVLFYTGCGTSGSTATTTTSPTTTTIVPVPNTISGTITLPAPGVASCLWVGASTDPTFANGTLFHNQEMEYTVEASVTTINYSVPISTTGTYYIAAVLAVGRATYAGSASPSGGDRVGEYLDGKVPSNFGQSQAETGTPTAIGFTSGDAITGKNFELKVTW